MVVLMATGQYFNSLSMILAPTFVYVGGFFARASDKRTKFVCDVRGLERMDLNLKSWAVPRAAGAFFEPRLIAP